MQYVRAGNSHPDAVSLLLAGSLCALPFLLPYHQLPVLSFQAEWLAVALGLAAMLAALVNGRHGVFVAVPHPAKWLIAFSLLLALQALAGNANYSQHPFLGALYVLYAALLFWLGAQLAASAGIERAATMLAACLLAGALANAAAGMIQFYGRPALLEDFVAELHGNTMHNGAYGNIGQSNLYANYLAVGGTALLLLWRNHKLRTGYALAAALLLAWAAALSGSRSTLIYALWFVMLAALSARIAGGTGSEPLKFPAYGAAGMVLAAQLLVPWMNDALELGPESMGAFERMVELSGEHREARWSLWLLALRIFAAAPVLGAGVGEFAGAVFDLGISREMAPGQIWTSAHNLPLHLLAETGVAGTALALAGLGAWCWQTGRRYASSPQPALWWIVAAVGIELIHSMFEYPLWNAHFLGVTALLMGLATTPKIAAGKQTQFGRTLAAGICAALALTLAVLLRDYLRLDATRVTGTSLTLESPADRERDAAVMRDLARGPLAPTAELWMFLGAPLDRSELAAKLKMSERVMRYFPSNAVIVRRAVLLAFDGQAQDARQLLFRSTRAFPHLCRATVSILEQALAADPAVIAPLLALAKGSNTSGCL